MDRECESPRRAPRELPRLVLSRWIHGRLGHTLRARLRRRLHSGSIGIGNRIGIGSGIGSGISRHGSGHGNLSGHLWSKFAVCGPRPRGCDDRDQL